jgi:hypothetical protein
MVRLAAFVVIAAGILDKNGKMSHQPRARG